MKKLVLFLLTIFSCTWLWAQQPITGVVLDEQNIPLPGVSVLVSNTQKVTVTDANGSYHITALSSDTLVFSMLGMTPQRIFVGNQSVINVTLQPLVQELSEVVVIGYGTVRKSDLTGAVSSLKSSEITKITSLNAEQGLQGKVSGVQVTSTSGAPGAAPTVRIRGVGTFNNSSPIFVVDGVILDDISFLSSADIASMEVLKDASATAIYGSRGANGVIMVTTKSGKAGEEKVTFNYSGEYGIQQLARKIDLLSGKEFATIFNEIKPGSYNNIDAVPNTDWQDLVFRAAPVQSHQFSASGSTKQTQYYVGLSYFKQEGIIEKSNYERITLKFNNTYNLTRFFKLGNNLTIAPYKQQNAPGVVFSVYRAWPLLQPYRADGSFAGVPGVGNPLADLDHSNNKNKGIRAVGNIFAEATFLKGFTFKTSLGVDGAYNKAVSFTPAYSVLYYDGTASMQNNLLSDLYKGSNDNLSLLWENTLSYYKSMGKHTIDLVAGYTMQNTSSEILSLSGEDILRDASDFWYMKGNYIYVKDKIDRLNDVNNSVNNDLNYAMISYLFRANYTFNNKYILTATFRRDGSSKFSSQNRYSSFPSFAAGWNISKEDFMESITAIHNLKLRGSWGKIGNEKIPYAGRFSVTRDMLGVFGAGDISYPGVTYGTNGNPDLKWETTTQTDAGVEMSFLNGRLTGEFDYYHRVTEDILVQLSTPGHMGNGQGQKVWYNAGKVLNSGFEANINWRDKIGEFSYGIGLLGSTIHNEVQSVGGNSGVDSLLYGGNIYGFVTQSRKGLPIGAFWGYKTDGVFQDDTEFAAYPHTGDAQVGYLRRVDVNGDKVIDGGDRTYIGSPIPKFIFGFNFDMQFKSIDFSFNLQGQTGNKIFNGKEVVRPDPYNFEKRVMDRWTGPGTSNTVPKATFGGYNYIPSDYFIQDGSFLRVRNVVLGYTIPVSVSRKAFIQQCRFYLKGNNLYTLTKFTGYTPEIGSQDVISNGIDMGIYPISAVYSFGVNLTF